MMKRTGTLHGPTHRSNPDGRASEPTPDGAVARIVLELEKIVTLMRQASTQRAFRRDQYKDFCPTPSNMEAAILIALAQTYGQAIIQDPRFYPVLFFVAERGGISLVQQVLFGESMNCTPSEATFNDALSSLLEEVRPAFEFLCSASPEVFLAQANTALRGLGLSALARPMNRWQSGYGRSSDGEAGALC